MAAAACAAVAAAALAGSQRKGAGKWAKGEKARDRQRACKKQKREVQIRGAREPEYTARARKKTPAHAPLKLDCDRSAGNMCKKTALQQGGKQVPTHWVWNCMGDAAPTGPCSMEIEAGGELTKVSGEYMCTCTDTIQSQCCLPDDPCTCVAAELAKHRAAHPMAAHPMAAQRPLRPRHASAAGVTATHFWVDDAAVRGHPVLRFYIPTWSGGTWGFDGPTPGTNEIHTTHRTAILAAAHEIEKNSCVEMREIDVSGCTQDTCDVLLGLDNAGTPYAKINSFPYNNLAPFTDTAGERCSDYSGCSGVASVPYTTLLRGQQNYRPYMQLSPGCCEGFTGVIVHEFMHLLGFKHEQSRPDRDAFIIVNWDNTDEDDQFEKMDPVEWHHYTGQNAKYQDLKGNIIASGIAGTDSEQKSVAEEDAAFDFDSVMLYGSFTFASGDSPTMTRLDGVSTWEQPGELSKHDSAQLSHLYECGAPGAHAAKGYCEVGANRDLCDRLTDAARLKTAAPRQFCSYGSECVMGSVCTDTDYEGERWYVTVCGDQGCGGPTANMYCTCQADGERCFTKSSSSCAQSGGWAGQGGKTANEMCCACPPVGTLPDGTPHGGGTLVAYTPDPVFPATCAAYVCPAADASGRPLRKKVAVTATADTTAAPTGTCADAESCDAACCALSQLCSDHTCPSGHYIKSAEINCQLAACTDTLCCAANPACGAHACATGYVPDTDAKSYVTKACAGATCTDEECCVPATTCEAKGFVAGDREAACPADTDPAPSQLCQEFSTTLPCNADRCCDPINFECIDYPEWQSSITANGAVLDCDYASANDWVCTHEQIKDRAETGGKTIVQACCACSRKCVDCVDGWKWGGDMIRDGGIVSYGQSFTCEQMGQYTNSGTNVPFCDGPEGKETNGATDGKSAQQACCACDGTETKVTYPGHYDQEGEMTTSKSQQTRGNQAFRYDPNTARGAAPPGTPPPAAGGGAGGGGDSTALTVAVGMLGALSAGLCAGMVVQQRRHSARGQQGESSFVYVDAAGPNVREMDSPPSKDVVGPSPVEESLLRGESGPPASENPAAVAC